MSYFNRTKLTDSSGTLVNPTQDETVILLRRMVKILESNAVVDSLNRQRVTVEVMPTTATTISSGTVTTVSTISNVAAMGGVDPRWQFVDQARNTFANSIRSKLSWS